MQPTAQIIPLHPELMPIQQSPLSRPDIRYLTLREQLDDCVNLEREIGNKLEEWSAMEKRIRDGKLELLTMRSQVRKVRQETEDHLSELLNQYPDVGD